MLAITVAAERVPGFVLSLTDPVVPGDGEWLKSSFINAFCQVGDFSGVADGCRKQNNVWEKACK